jgi:hypothetical protein
VDIDAPALLALGLPKLEPLGPQGFPGFESEGEEALEWWQRLRAVSDRNGRWPLLLDHHTGALNAGFSKWDGELPQIDDPSPDVVEKELELWPASLAGGVHSFHLPLERWTQEPKRVMVALLPTRHGWEVPRLTGFGGWNRCPPPQVHTAMLKRWHERWGADLVCLTRTSLELGLTRPPRTRREALSLAWDYASYCNDGVEAIYQADSLAGLAAGLINADVVHCWWD